MTARAKTIPVTRDFYENDTLFVARNLLGKLICRKVGKELIICRIVETEAYIGDHDPAAHSYGRVTERNRVMYGKAGFAYVYFIYGNYHCFNVVTGAEGCGDAVLIRAGEITCGIRTASSNRNYPVNITDIANGPAKLCIALEIDRSLNGHDLTKKGELFIAAGADIDEDMVLATRRIGLTKGVELNYRFIIRNDPHVTRHRHNRESHTHLQTINQ